MEVLVILGGFAAVAVFGWFLMARLDGFLARSFPEAKAPPRRLTVATACCETIPAVSRVLGQLRQQYPGVQCSVSVGQPQQVLQSLDAGAADVVIVPAAQGSVHPQWHCAPLPACPDETDIAVRPLGCSSQPQQILWKKSPAPSLVQEFIHQLCGQQP